MQIADISVLTTRLPAVDRGTLSQAWVDALHLQRDAYADAGPRRLSRTAAGPVRTERTLQQPQSAAHPIDPARGRSQTGRAMRYIGPHRESTATVACSRPAKPQLGKNPQLRAAESAIIHLPCGERLCLLMRGSPDAVVVTVLCSPAMRARVAAAMVHIRGVLANEGTHCKIEFARNAA